MLAKDVSAQLLKAIVRVAAALEGFALQIDSELLIAHRVLPFWGRWRGGGSVPSFGAH